MTSTKPTTLDTLENLVSYHKDAAQQRLYLEAHQEDREFERSGGMIFYSVDVDVIKLFSDTVAMSLPQKSKYKREGYAQIFRQDPEELTIALGQSLARYIFYQLSQPERPLLLLPPLDGELGRVFGAVVKNAHKQQGIARGQQEKLTKLIDKLPQKNLATALSRAAPELATLIKGLSGPTAELSRLSKLIADKKFASPEYIVDKKISGYEPIIREISPIEGVENIYNYLKIQKKWSDLLHSSKLGKRSKNTINADAAVLARIEWINRVLAGEREKTHVNVKCRIVHITGDAGILKAAAKANVDEMGASFGDLYIRHPRSFLGEPQVFLGDGAAESPARSQNSSKGVFPYDNLFDLLDIILPMRSEFRNKRNSYLRSILEARFDKLSRTLQPTLNQNPSVVSSFHKKWKQYADNVAAKRLSREVVAEYWGGDIGNTKRIEGILDAVKGSLESKIEESWSECIRAVTSTSLGIISSSSKDTSIVSRNAPPLYFAKLKDAQKVIIDIYNLKREDASEEISRLNQKFPNKASKSKYLFYVCAAYIFAAAGRWGASAILCDQALHALAQDSSKHPPYVSGREATYLKAVALRHCVQSPKDLDRVSALLDETFRLLERDLKEAPGLEVWPIRFEIERLAVELTSYMFERFLNKKSKFSLRSLDKMQDDFIRMYKEIPFEMDNWMKRKVQRNLLTNIFSCALIRHFEEKDQFDFSGLRVFLSDFNEISVDQEEGRVNASYLVDVVLGISNMWLEQDSKKRREYSRKMTALLSDQQIEKNAVMPYDIERFRHLRRIVEAGY